MPSFQQGPLCALRRPCPFPGCPRTWESPPPEKVWFSGNLTGAPGDPYLPRDRRIPREAAGLALVEQVPALGPDTRGGSWHCPLSCQFAAFGFAFTGLAPSSAGSSNGACGGAYHPAGSRACALYSAVPGARLLSRGGCCRAPQTLSARGGRLRAGELAPARASGCQSFKVFAFPLPLIVALASSMPIRRNST